MEKNKNLRILDCFFSIYHFDKQEGKLVVDKTEDVDLTYDFSDLHKITGLKEILINCPGNLYSSGDMIFYRSEDKVTLVFCSGNTKDVVVPDGVNVVGECAFESTAIRSVVLPESLEEISRWAFAKCNSLSTVNLPKNLKKIKGSAFAACSNLRSIVLPESLEVIEDSAFYKCLSLESVTLPKSLKELPDEIFMHCSVLSEISLPDSLETIGDHAFSGCVGMRTIKLPKNLKKLGCHAFYNCEKLQSIKIPESLKEIATGTFMRCFSLTEVKLPKKLKTLQDYAFSHCENLKSIEGSDELSCIGNHVFHNCKSLTQLNLPDYPYLTVGILPFCNSGIDEISIQSSDTFIQERGLAGMKYIRVKEYIPSLIEAVACVPESRLIFSDELETGSFCIEYGGKKLVFPVTMSRKAMGDADAYFKAAVDAQRGDYSVQDFHHLGYTPAARHQTALDAYKMSENKSEFLREYLEMNGAEMVDEIHTEDDLLNLLRDFRDIGISQKMAEKALALSEENDWTCAAAYVLELSRGFQQFSFSL